MNDLRDFRIEKEILPLFDYSLNVFAKQKILEILSTPLSSIKEILHRQHILKGFAQNHKILKDYSYTVLFVNEVYFFLDKEKIEDLSQKKWQYKLFASRLEKAKYTSKFNQLILFFFRLESRYFTRLNTDCFPDEYRQSIQRILHFLACFELHKYEYIIREKKLKDKHIIELTKKINNLKKDELIPPFWNDFFLFEAYLSIHFGILENHFSFPKFTKNHIKLTDLYHPLIKKPIKNDFEANCSVVVINGPNMSGKSTFLKAVGLCVYLGHLGIGIPASAGEIPFFDYFFVYINRHDDITNGYSHFMTEILQLKKVIEQASLGKRCFAIFDELFSGTNVEDGFEICKTTINGLPKFKDSVFFISTHIQELKNVVNEKTTNYHIDCKLIKNKPTFTYQLTKGWSDIKVGRILFEKEGLNKLLQ